MAGKKPKPKNATPRKPPTAADAATFVAGGPTPAGQTEKKPPSIFTRKRTGEDVHRLTIYLPRELANTVLKRCIDEHRTLSEVMSELAGAWVSR